MEKAHPRYLRPGRPISVSAVPFGPGIVFWRSCRFIGAMMRSLCLLPGGLGRFVPCSIVANHCRLQHIGWEKCGHGLTSRPRESASEGFLDELLVLFGYPPACGHVRGLVTEFAGVAEVPRSRPLAHAQLPGLVGGARVLCGRRILGRFNRVRLRRKTAAHITGFGGDGSSKGLEEIEG